ncbi:MAG: hypothetical protein KJ630_10045 [Proteobacteria bacterium]|nr:hypothetical protein [Pseudomonadota bacterium]
MEKRRHPRMVMNNLDYYASDGVGYFRGEISDASRFGLCLDNLPPNISPDIKRISLIVFGQGKNFKMSVTPKWTSRTVFQNTFGVEIQHPPLGWAEFISSFQLKTQEAVSFNEQDRLLA